VHCFIVSDDDAAATARGDDVFEYLRRRRTGDDARIMDDSQSGRVAGRARGHVIGYYGDRLSALHQMIVDLYDHVKTRFAPLYMSMFWRSINCLRYFC